MHILGINLNKLDKSYFKTSEKATNVDENIYNSIIIFFTIFYKHSNLTIY